MEHVQNICRLCLQEGLITTTIFENTESPEAKVLNIFGWNVGSVQNVETDNLFAYQVCYICRQELHRFIAIKSRWEQSTIKLKKLLAKPQGLAELKQELEGHNGAIDGDIERTIIHSDNDILCSEDVEDDDDHQKIVVKNENNNELLQTEVEVQRKYLENIKAVVTQANEKDIVDTCSDEEVFKTVEKIDPSKNDIALNSEDILKIEIEDHHIKLESSDCEIDEEMGWEEEYRDEGSYELDRTDSFEDDKEIQDMNQTSVSTSHKTHKKRKHKICKCEICGKKFLYELWWKKHMDQHKTKQIDDCEICGKWFNDKKLLFEHRKAHEPKVRQPKVEQKFECNDCGAVFTKKAMLAIHVQRHLGIAPLKCEICSKGFFFPTQLERHNISHTGEREFECAHCGKRYLKKSHLSQHIIAVHSSVKSFTCKVCDRSFSLGYQLRQHIKVHTGEKKAKCDICNKLFTRKTQLVRHQLTHTGEKPHKCHLCTRKFITNMELKRHIKFHEEGKPYKCDICKEQFMRAYNLQNHMRLHTGEKPYKCNSCGKGFAQTSALRSHEKAVRGCGANYTAKNRKKRTQKS